MEMSDPYDNLKNTPLIEAVRGKELNSIGELLASGADVNEQGEQGWTSLNWASGKGELDLVKLLVENGADVLRVGRDQRTPYMIALAAGHVDVAMFLRQAEGQAMGQETDRHARKYCKAYQLQDLRRFPNWVECKINSKEKKEDKIDKRNDAQKLTDDSVVFLHQDYIVTQSMWHDETVIFNAVTSKWVEFCSNNLAFSVPDDMDLIVSDFKQGLEI
jgi:uncharacterized protein